MEAQISFARTQMTGELRAENCVKGLVMSYCRWDLTSEENMHYHDTEWGVPLHDDRRQFEFLSLEVMQCGLSWGLMIKKREIFRECFENFEFEKIAGYGEAEITRILTTEGMIRSRRKVEAIINNARRFLEIREEFGTFSKFLWDYTGGKTILYNKHAEGYIPVSNGLSDAISRELKRRGFQYVGPVTIYSHLQAAGLINDHDQNCPCRQKIIDLYPTTVRKRYLEKKISYYGD